jgi:hypothetical protein
VPFLSLSRVILEQHFQIGYDIYSTENTGAKLRLILSFWKIQDYVELRMSYSLFLLMFPVVFTRLSIRKPRQYTSTYQDIFFLPEPH